MLQNLKIRSEYYGQLYANKVSKFSETDKFLERFKIQKFTQE